MSISSQHSRIRTRIATAVMAFFTVLGTVAGTVTSFMGAMPAVADEAPFSGTHITAQKGIYDYYDSKQITYAYDFSAPRIGQYATDPAVALGQRANAVLENQTLSVKPGTTFSFGSALCLGDDYGLAEGYMTFDLCLTGGTVSAGVRVTKVNATRENRGLWFTFAADGSVTVEDPTSQLAATVATGLDLSGAIPVVVHDAKSNITLHMDGQIVLCVAYSEDGHLSVADAAGKVLAETDASELYITGFCELLLDDTRGFVDNFSFTHVELSRDIPTAQTLRQIDYSSWTATDDLGRTVADNSVAGAPKAQRDVGLFYFLCWVGAGGVVQDNTKMYVDGGIQGVKDFFKTKGGEAYWAEPYFGYYRNTDTWVYRKHAYMLESAGVDFIFLDVSNAEVFITGHMALFDTWLEMRREGIDTPQICFFCGDNPDTFISNMKTLLTTVYSTENWSKYQELFYCWEGKPLVFGNTSKLSGVFRAQIEKKFTTRGNWAWCDKDGYWSWMQEYRHGSDMKRIVLVNGGWGRDKSGKLESLAVSLGYHATSSKGRSFVNQKQANNGQNDYEFSSIARAAQGLSFADQFASAQVLIQQKVPADDPFVLLITGWNEWIAGCTRLDKEQSFCNGTADFLYVDNFNAEFSRDAEPMRNYNGYGFGDNYYYQMVDYIRQFKGISPAPVADHQTSINLLQLSEWEAIQTQYQDSIMDVELRNSICYDANYRYINHTGRNDFDTCKVSQDDHYLYFLARCTNDIIIDNGSTWMNLFLNTDHDASTGWDGYDYVLNRDRDSFVVSVEKLTVAEDRSLTKELVGGAYYYLKGNQMVIQLAKDVIGGKDLMSDFTFKWADNSVDLDGLADPMGFMDLGDAAPDDRYSFLYLCDHCETLPTQELSFSQQETTYTSTSRTQVTCPPAVPSITLEKNTVDILYDMDDATAGSYISDTDVNTYLQFMGGTPASTAQLLQGGREGTGNYVCMKGFSDLRTWTDIEPPCEIAVDLRMTQFGDCAVYIRGEMPGAFAPKNPKNFNVTQTFNYYEWDWYAENGGSTFGGSSTAGSGIGIYPKKDNLTIRIKRYAPDGLTVASATHTFPYPEGLEDPTSTWMRLRCVDDNERVRIYLNDILICTILMEQPGVIYDSDQTGQTYYGLSTLYDADGQEVLVVENTRLNSAGSQLALTTRNQTFEFDNIHVSFDQYLMHGSHTETMLERIETVQSYQPDTRLLQSLMPARTPEPLDTDAHTEEPVSQEPTVTVPSPETSEGPSTTTQTSNEGGCHSTVWTAWPMLLFGLLGGVWHLMRRKK